MAFKEYPKMIYCNGKGIIVNNKEEEAKITKIEEAHIKEEKKSGWGK